MQNSADHPESGSTLFNRRVPHVRGGRLQGNTAVIDLEGKVLEDQPIQDMKGALLELPAICRNVRLRFDDVKFFSSAALGSLITLDRRLRGKDEDGTYLSMSGMPPEVFEVFMITKLDRLFGILGLQCSVATFRVQEDGIGVIRLQGRGKNGDALSEQGDVFELAKLLHTVLGVVCKEVVVDASGINTLSPDAVALLQAFQEKLLTRDPPAQLTLHGMPPSMNDSYGTENGFAHDDDRPMDAAPAAAIRGIRLPEGERQPF